MTTPLTGSPLLRQHKHHTIRLRDRLLRLCDTVIPQIAAGVPLRLSGYMPRLDTRRSAAAPRSHDPANRFPRAMVTGDVTSFSRLCEPVRLMLQQGMKMGSGRGRDGNDPAKFGFRLIKEKWLPRRIMNCAAAFLDE